MKSFLVFGLALIFLIPLARTVFAAPAEVVGPTNVARLPFKGTLRSDESYSTIASTLFVTATGSGESTELGSFIANYHTEVNLLDLSEAESIQFTASNSNTLQAKGIGQAIEDRTPGMYNVIEIYTITGGTGRFKDASGTFTLKRLVSRTVGVAESQFEGYILIP